MSGWPGPARCAGASHGLGIGIDRCHPLKGWVQEAGQLKAIQVEVRDAHACSRYAGVTLTR